MVKNSLWFLLIIAFFGCNEKPTFPTTPSIGLSGFYFREIQNSSLDSLVLTINFEDGDGDLGLESFEDYPPYHILDTVFNDGDYVRPSDPGAPEYDCVNYEILREETSVNDSLVITADTIQVVRNPDYYNFYLEFLIKVNNDSFRVYNPALERNCAPPFHGRYFVLNTLGGIRPLEGELQYNLLSGFRLLFRNEIIKMRIQIQDRQLNKSNIIETDEFSIYDKILPP